MKAYKNPIIIFMISCVLGLNAANILDTSKDHGAFAAALIIIAVLVLIVAASMAFTISDERYKESLRAPRRE